MANKYPLGSLVGISGLSEFGVGKLVGYDDGVRPIVAIAGEGKRVLSPSMKLVRISLANGTRVRFTVKGEPSALGTIAHSAGTSASGANLYCVDSAGEERLVSEADLLPLVDEADPIQLLKAFKWDAPRDCYARWAMADAYARWAAESSGFPVLFGARINPLGHQIYAARRVLGDRRPRFILADEVGLGKTIEAGLVVQALLAVNPALRVLVVAPGSMSRQWLTELYLRFGGRAYTHLDATRLASLNGRDLTRLLESPNLIVATTALEADPTLGQMLAAKPWDMVVIDEAHHFPPGSTLFPLMQQLAAGTEGLLLLSATPSKRSISGLAGLLSLVAPQSFPATQADALADRVRQQAHIWDRLNFTNRMLESTQAEGRGLDPDEAAFVAEEWEGLLDQDETVQQFLARLRHGDARAAGELVAYVQEFHRLDHRIVRTRRATLKQSDLRWAPRMLEAIPYEPSVEEGIYLSHLQTLPAAEGTAAALRSLYLRFSTSTPRNAMRFLTARLEALADPSPAVADPISLLAADHGAADEGILLTQLLSGIEPLPGEADWLQSAAALAQAWFEADPLGGRIAAIGDWIDTHLSADDANQVLIFAQDHAAAAQVAAALKERIGKGVVASFHVGMGEEDLASTAFRFQHDRRLRVLVCDELGGEGRNFQNASAVVHFDLPLLTARIEQRIGRLDRVGRPASRPVLSVVVEPRIPEEQALLEAQRDVFQVFTRSVGGLEFALPSLQRQMVEAHGGPNGAFRALLPHLRQAVETELSSTDEAFELSLDATKPQLDAAVALARAIEASSVDADVAGTVTRWVARFGVHHKSTEDGQVEFSWTNGGLRVPAPGLRIGSGDPDARRSIRGTFDRSHALASENLQFFGPGHPLVDALALEAEGGAHSRATAFILEGFPSNRGTVLLQLLGRSSLAEAHWPPGGLPTHLLARGRAALWSEVLAEIMVLWRPTKGATGGILGSVSLRSLLDNPSPDRKLKPVQPSEFSMLPFAKEVWAALDAAVPNAIASLKARLSPVARDRAGQLEASFRNEIGFLTWQQRTGSDQVAEEARRAIAVREALVASVREAKVEPLAVALVVLA